MEPFTLDEQLSACGNMLQQMRGQLLQATIMDRIMARKKLINQMTTGDMNADGQNRSNISQLRHSMEHLLEIRKQLLEEQGKAE